MFVSCERLFLYYKFIIYMFVHVFHICVIIIIIIYVNCDVSCVSVLFWVHNLIYSKFIFINFF